MIQLFDYWRSSASYRVRIALGLAGLQWESVTIDLVKGEQRSAEHLSRNPQGLVPALEIDGQIFTQSLAIIEYLDETRALGLLAGTAAKRARLRALAQAIAIDIHPICNLRVAKYAIEQSQGAITMKGWMQAFIGPGLEAVEAMIEDGPYCAGARVTLPDLCLLPQIYNAQRWEVDLNAMPKLRQIAAQLETLPAFGAAHPDKTPH